MYAEHTIYTKLELFEKQNENKKNRTDTVNCRLILIAYETWILSKHMIA